MPQIICHECGRIRLVVKGKRKNCRGCGTRLTDQQQPLDKVKAKQKAEQKPKISIADLADMYPNQVAGIVQAAKADAVATEFLDVSPDEVQTAFPEQVDKLLEKATAELDEKLDAAAKELKDAVAAAKKEGQKAVLLLTPDKIAKLQKKMKKETGKAKKPAEK